jgi:hypothetical protein
MACNLASRREAQQGRRILDWSLPSVSAYLVGRGLGIGIGNACSSPPSEAGDASRMPILADRHSGPFRCPQIFGGQGSRGAPVVEGMQLKQARTPPGLAPEDTGDQGHRTSTVGPEVSSDRDGYFETKPREREQRDSRRGRRLEPRFTGHLVRASTVTCPAVPSPSAALSPLWTLRPPTPPGAGPSSTSCSGSTPWADDVRTATSSNARCINRASHVPTNVPTTRDLSGFVRFHPPPPHSE